MTNAEDFIVVNGKVDGIPTINLINKNNITNMKFSLYVLYSDKEIEEFGGKIKIHVQISILDNLDFHAEFNAQGFVDFAEQFGAYWDENSRILGSFKKVIKFFYKEKPEVFSDTDKKLLKIN
jgi:hypothetical protein